MTIDSVAPSELGLVRFATPYLEVETQSTSAMERAIVGELAQARLAAKRRKRKRGDQPIRRRDVGDGLGSPAL